MQQIAHLNNLNAFTHEQLKNEIAKETPNFYKIRDLATQITNNLMRIEVLRQQPATK